MINEATLDRRQDAARRRFLFALLFSTWLPMLFFILLAPLETDYFSIKGMKSAFLFFLFYHTDTFRGFELVKSNAFLVRSFDFVFGAVLGATMAHFVIDAGAWRLRERPQREYMSQRFGFMFNLKDSARAPLNLQGTKSQGTLDE